MATSLKDAFLKAGVVKASETPQARQEAAAKQRRKQENDELDARMNEPAPPPFEAAATGKIVEQDKAATPPRGKRA